MDLDSLRMPKASAHCLSQWQVSQLVLGVLPVPERQAAEIHAETCASCGLQVQMERSQMQTAAVERVPAELLEPARSARKPAFFFGGWLGPLVLAAAAVVLVLYLPKRGVAVRVKGTAALEVTVRRGDQVIATQVSLENVAAWHTGDRLRLHAAGTSGKWLVVQGYEEGQWRTYFSGPTPADGWLPMGLALTSDGETRLRWFVCGDETAWRKVPVPTDGGENGCREQVFELKARP